MGKVLPWMLTAFCVCLTIYLWPAKKDLRANKQAVPRRVEHDLAQSGATAVNKNSGTPRNGRDEVQPTVPQPANKRAPSDQGALATLNSIPRDSRHYPERTAAMLALMNSNVAKEQIAYVSLMELKSLDVPPMDLRDNDDWDAELASGMKEPYNQAAAAAARTYVNAEADSKVAMRELASVISHISNPMTQLLVSKEFTDKHPSLTRQFSDLLNSNGLKTEVDGLGN